MRRGKAWPEQATTRTPGDRSRRRAARFMPANGPPLLTGGLALSLVDRVVDVALRLVRLMEALLDRLVGLAQGVVHGGVRVVGDRLDDHEVAEREDRDRDDAVDQHRPWAASSKNDHP